MSREDELKLIHNYLKKNNLEALYVSRPNVFEKEFDILISSFKKYYNNIKIAYSFKTNYLPDFVKIINKKNGYAEVVSIMELELALKCGFDYKNIFFNGPFKHLYQTQNFLSNGGLVNVDSIDEFVSIKTFAESTKTKCRLGIRLNFNLHEYPSRFGISVDDDSINLILDTCLNSDYLVLESLHYHYAPRDLKIWNVCSHELIKFLKKIDLNKLSDIKFISLGGGMFSRMDKYIKSQLPFNIPKFEEYALNSVKLLGDFLKLKIKLNAEILIEPGTALASKSLDFIAKVVSLKNINNKIYINISGSKYNMNPSPNRINSPTHIYNTNEFSAVKVQNAKLCGYTCIESDIIHDNFNGNVAKNDIILFKEIGSYSLVMKPPFILPDIQIVEIEDFNNSIRLVRTEQSFDNIFNSFNL